MERIQSVLERLVNRARDNRPLWNAVRIVREQFRPKTFEQWEKRGKPLPLPHAVKANVILEFMKERNIQIFIETGTYLGDMVNAVKDTAKAIHTIEIDPTFHQRSKDRFKGENHIHCHLGDSAKIIPHIMKGIEEPCLIWLDAHYSGGSSVRAELQTPIIQEIKILFDHPIDTHVILVDDARLFNGKYDFPAIDAFEIMVHEHKPEWVFENKLDIIRIYKSSDRFAPL